MKASFNIIVHNGFSMDFSIRGSSAWCSRERMVRVVTALDIQVSLRYPTAMLEDSMVSVKTLHTWWGEFINREMHCSFSENATFNAKLILCVCGICGKNK